MEYFNNDADMIAATGIVDGLVPLGVFSADDRSFLPACKTVTGQARQSLEAPEQGICQIHRKQEPN
jgi:hypothetical protein